MQVNYNNYNNKNTNKVGEETKMITVSDIFEDYNEVKSFHKHLLVMNSDNELFLFKKYSREKAEVLEKLCEKQKENENLKLAKIVEIKSDSKYTYTIEEWYTGMTLTKYLKDNKLSEEQCLYFLKKMLENLDFLEKNNLIHRDIKPDNIIVLKKFHDKIFDFRLIDFDISREYNVMKKRDTKVLGTEGYVAPEQRGALQTTTKADIYSLGQTLQQMFVSGVYSNELKEIILKMTAFAPDGRPTLKELNNMLEKTQKQVSHTKIRNYVLISFLVILFDLYVAGYTLFYETEILKTFSKFEVFLLTVVMIILLYIIEVGVYYTFSGVQKKLMNYINYQLTDIRFLRNAVKIFAYFILYYLYFFLTILILFLLLALIGIITI